ncbi:armadillo-type protein [Abortiporus biennis]|nr:armadillo-type protein [Abortiporus biennis]
MPDDDSNQNTFKKLKQFCVPLLGNARLSPVSTPLVLKLLSDITTTLQSTQGSLSVSLISYVFFPLSTILRSNPLPTIPDQVLEKLLRVLTLLCEDWWWSFDESPWEQIFMLCGALLGEIGSKGKGKERDDETKEAAATCLYTILRERKSDENPEKGARNVNRATEIRSRFQIHAQTDKFIPIVGQTIDSLLGTAESPHRPLQKQSLALLHIIIKDYFPERIAPTILPGVVSKMCRIALGSKESKGWANGDIVAASLVVMQDIIIQSISDEFCIRDGAVRSIHDLADLTEDIGPSQTQEKSKYATIRSAVWLQGTSSQLHIALNSLHSLVSHPTPAAIYGLASFSREVLAATTLTLPQSQPLLLTFLLSATSSPIDSVSSHAKLCMKQLLTPPFDARYTLLEVILRLSQDHLSSLPRHLRSHSDSKVEHAANLINAICGLTMVESGRRISEMEVVSVGVSKLLGPNGGIQKWGWSLLSTLEFSPPSVTVTRSSATPYLLEGNAIAIVPFPEITLKALTSHSAQTALEDMFRSLGRVAGEKALYSVEWFLNVGQGGRSARCVAALWCASRLLEGISHISLNDFGDGDNPRIFPKSKRLDKFCRSLARSLAEMWDNEELLQQGDVLEEPSHIEDNSIVEHVSGLKTIRAGLMDPKNLASSSEHSNKSGFDSLLHKALALQLLAITSGVLQARFTPLFLYTLYPVLRSLISPSHYLSTAGLAALNYMATFTSYASPANMLLSNFDYALDSVSRRLSRRWLDIDATQVLVMLVRLVGRDIVSKAGDVVEECFDRLDEYHGYEVLVDGLIAVLAEVVEVVATDVENITLVDDSKVNVEETSSRADATKIPAFLDWYEHRKDPPADVEEEEDFGPVPQRAWGSADKEEPEDEGNLRAEDPDPKPPITPTQVLTSQIVSRSMYFLTHGSPVIRSKILTLLGSAATVLPASSIMPSIHYAWPFILNRLTDPEPFVVCAAAQLIESLSAHVGESMYRRVWDDVWPRFKTILSKLAEADASSALARRGPAAVGTQSAYTQSHRLYRALLRTMAAAVKGIQPNDSAIWEVIMLFRRFLHREAHEELQAFARGLYQAIAANNEDAVWLALKGTEGEIEEWIFLHEKWNISQNVELILQEGP